MGFIAAIVLVGLGLGVSAIAYQFGVTDTNDLVCIFLLTFIVSTFIGLWISNGSLKKTIASFF